MLLTAAFLSACSSVPDKIALKDISEPAQINSFQLTGRIAFMTPKERHSAGLYWQVDNSQYDIRLTTLLGISIAKLTGRPGFIQIKADGDTYQSNSPNALIEDVVGWPIPVNQLSNWVLGLHGGVVISKDEKGRTKRALVRVSATEEWTLTYRSYVKIGSISLPQVIECERYQTRLILKINQWNKINQ